MKILVTGSSGFIGKHLVEALRSETLAGVQGRHTIVGVSRKATRYPHDLSPQELVNFDARGLHSTYYWESGFEEVNCDLTIEQQVGSLMLRFKPDVVFHLAGDPLVKNWDPAVTRSHTLSTHHLLTYAPAGCRFVHASSATVYGDPRYPGHRFHESDLLRPTSAYGAAKAGAESLVRAFTQTGKVKGLCLRLAATVGAGATHGLVPDLVRKLLFAKTPVLDLHGQEPGSVKPFTHVSDVVAGMIHFGLGKAVGAINLAVDDNMTVLDAALTAMAVLGVNKPLQWTADAVWKGDNPKVLVDSGDARMLDWVPAFPTSREAVARAVAELAGVYSKGVAA